jgi:hypothetical protein
MSSNSSKPPASISRKRRSAPGGLSVPASSSVSFPVQQP